MAVGAARADLLRSEYGPAPWWDGDALAELLEERGLSPAAIASIWNVSESTVRQWQRHHRAPPSLSGAWSE